jgi:hypothetical protein
METKMKTVNFKNTLKVGGILSLMGTTLAMDGSSEDLLNIPTGNVRKGPSVGNVEKLTFENGQFTATINRETRIVENHEVSKDLKTLIAINKLEEYINADGKLSIGKPGNAYIDLNGELLGGGIRMFKPSPFGPIVGPGVDWNKVGRSIFNWIKTEVAKPTALNYAIKGAYYATDQTVKGAKWVGKQIGKGVGKVWPF